MPQYVDFDTLKRVWAELGMKFPGQIQHITVHPHARLFVFKLRGISKEVRDNLIFRSFCNRPGMGVGFHKPRRSHAAHRNTPPAQRPEYTVWISVYTSCPYALMTKYMTVGASPRDFTEKDFEAWLDYAEMRMAAEAGYQSS